MHKKIILISCILILSILFGGLSGYIVSRSIIQNQNTNNQIMYTENSETPTDVPVVNLQTEILSAIDVVKLCNNSVVNIEVETVVKSYTGGSEYSKTEKSYGTGVVIEKDGYIATCYHVVEDAEKITIITNDDTRYVAEMIGYDAQFDLAVVRIDADLAEVVVGDVSALQPGESTVIIGNPLGEFGSSVSVGVISSTEREVTVGGEPLRLIQTDAAINPGNSGGGMFNMQGQLIGIVNAKMSAAGIEGLGFAIPINTIQSKIDAFIRNDETNEKAVLGVSSKATVCYIEGEQNNCVEIVSIREDSAAARADLRVGDRILSANGKKITNNDDLIILVKYSKPGDSITFSVWRDIRIVSITVILGSNN